VGGGGRRPGTGHVLRRRLTVTTGGAPTRFAGFLSDDEQEWLAGTGARPRTVAEQLPPRAAVLVPHAGHGDWVGVLRHERVRVVDGAVVRRRRRGEQVLATRGAVTSVTWVVENGPLGVGLAPDALGWLVLHGPEGVLAALALREWDPGWGARTSSTAAVRRTGAEALAGALGLPLDVVTDRAEAGLRFGRVPRGRVVALRARRPAAYVVATAAAIAVVTLGLFVPGLQPLRWAPWVLLLATAATVARRATLMREIGRVGWAEPLHVAPSAPGQPAPALGVVDDELVVCDGTGWEARVLGPALGGVGAVVVARDETGQPWALLLVDRDEQVLLTLPAVGWGVAADAVAVLGAALAPAGLVVTGAQIDRPVGATTGDGPAAPAPVGWPPVAAALPWRVPPEPTAVLLLLVATVVLAVPLVLDRAWGGVAVTLCSLAGLVLATPLARIMAR
jgi:hypothetical protein